jgi:hypothetical protein
VNKKWKILAESGRDVAHPFEKKVNASHVEVGAILSKGQGSSNSNSNQGGPRKGKIIVASPITKGYRKKAEVGRAERKSA